MAQLVLPAGVFRPHPIAMKNRALVLIKIGYCQRSIHEEIVVGINKMLRQPGYPPHRTFNSAGVERRASSRQTIKNIIM